MAKNNNLHTAMRNKNDEFYTMYNDIEDELLHYTEHFKNKIIYCNCDNPKYSNFWKYFHINFNKLGLKKLIATHYKAENISYKIEYIGKNDNDINDGIISPLRGDGDFRSNECIEILKEADIIITNPPFSLFKQYIAQLLQYNKHFIIWGNNNAITYKNIFNAIKNNELWLGYLVNKTCIFRLADNYDKWDIKITQLFNDGYKYGKVPAISVFTNLDIEKRHQFLNLHTNYFCNTFYKYNNYNAINIDKINDIPFNYDGIMGVSITFLDKYNPEQFQIIGIGYGESAKLLGMQPIGNDFLNKYFEQGNKGNYVANNVLCCYYDKDGNTKIPYARILIKRKKGL